MKYNITNREGLNSRVPQAMMNGSPASSTPTATRGASRSETPDILRDSSLLQSDESVIADQAHQTSSGTIQVQGGEMADKKEECMILEDLSEERIRKLEERRRGDVESKMDETPLGAEVEEVEAKMNETPMGTGVEEVETPQSQKAKTKEEKSKKSISKKTPEMVRDTPRKNTLRSGNSHEAEGESGNRREIEEES